MFKLFFCIIWETGHVGKCSPAYMVLLLYAKPPVGLSVLNFYDILYHPKSD